MGSEMCIRDRRQHDDHIPHKAQKCKCIQLTVQDEIMKINSLHSVDLKKNVLGAYSGSIDILFIKIIKT